MNGPVQVACVALPSEKRAGEARRVAQVARFTGPAQFADACRATLRPFEASHWAGGLTRDQACDAALRGDEAGLADALAIAESIAADIAPEVPQWRRAPFGGVAVVGEFLAGEPECMRVKARAPSQTAPLRIVVDTGSSAVIDARDLQKRGLHVAALVMALANCRPLSLCICDIGGDSGSAVALTVEHATNPLHLGQVMFALTNAAYTRGLTYGYEAKHLGPNGGWPYGVGPNKRAQYEAIMRAVCEAGPDDLIIPGAHIDDPLVKSPRAWVEQTVARYAGAADEGV